MARKGQQVAAAPVPRWDNLTIIERLGRTAFGETTWRIGCGCGFTREAKQVAIRDGSARCPVCNPFRHFAVDRDAKAIRALLPATYAQIMRAMGMSRSKAESRINAMRRASWCYVGDWQRPEAQGLYNPIFFAGKGKDAKCKLKAIPKNTVKRNYEKRVREAAEQAELTGIVVRYAYAVRKIRSRKADLIVREAVAKPQHPFSALGL